LLQVRADGQDMEEANTAMLWGVTHYGMIWFCNSFASMGKLMVGCNEP
jgi:hypothetical protein